MLFITAKTASGAAYSKEELKLFNQIIPELTSNPEYFVERMEELRDEKVKKHEALLERNIPFEPTGQGMQRYQLKPRKSELQKKK